MKTGRETGSLRIIGGRWRSRTLLFPATRQLRPTANRIRETLFNWLQHRIVEESCLDLFAGSGACGLEALSRGAQTVTFVEKNPRVAAAIRANLALLGEATMPVVCIDALQWLAENRGEEQFGVVFVDPPYGDGLTGSCCNALENSGLLKSDALIYLEADQELQCDPLPANWRMLKQKKAGKVYFGLFRREDVSPGGT